MAKEIIDYEVGRGTRIYCAPAHDCSYVAPEEVSFSATAAIAVNATSIAITASTNTKTILAPIWVKFVDSVTGKASTVKVTSDIAPGSTTLTVAPVKFSIPSGSDAEYPCRLGGRNSANLSTQDENVESEDFDNDGWKAFEFTALGYNLSANGNYLPTDPGWQTCHYTRYAFADGGSGKVYLKIVFPKPGCGDVFTAGDTYEGFAVITSMPIEATPKGLISGNIEFSFTGPVSYTPAA
jgi:hypothetical protein